MEEQTSVLPTNFSSGPHGLGDPNDRSLRKVEIEILIPKLMRDKAKTRCSDEVKAFETCCKANSFSMVIKCRKENTSLSECMQSWYKDPEFKRQCTEEYLEQRSQYRLTGIKNSIRRKPVETM